MAFAVLLLDQVGILGIAIQLTQPSDFAKALGSVRQGLTLMRIEMKGLGFMFCVHLNLVKRSEDLVVDRSPPVVLDTFVPSFMVIILFFVKMNVDGVLLLLHLHLVVVARSERVDINNCSVHENLVVDQRRELQASQAEPHVTLSSWVEEVCFRPVDAAEQLEWVSLVAEVNQVLVVFVNTNISVGTPGSLDLLSHLLVLCFKLDFLLPLKVPSPRPLDLDSCNVVHRESVVLEQTTRQGHFISSLDESSTEVLHALIFILIHQVEIGFQELLPEDLSCCVVLAVLTHRLVPHYETARELSGATRLGTAALSKLRFVLLLELLLELVDLSKLLDQLLVLELELLVRARVLHIVGLSLGHEADLELQLTLLLLKLLLLVVGNEHASFPSLLVDEPADGPLDLDGGQVLCSHGSGPGLLDYYSLAHFAHSLVVGNAFHSVAPMDARGSPNNRIIGRDRVAVVPVVVAQALVFFGSQGAGSLTKVSEVVRLHDDLVVLVHPSAVDPGDVLPVDL
mmetsp:Transcript_15748/g.24228  ORF Transcript_15748/g.24228 Transcript_15748/m.24228 type:complete len:511 (-) Transcript_15748:12-1544(-)